MLSAFLMLIVISILGLKNNAYRICLKSVIKLMGSSFWREGCSHGTDSVRLWLLRERERR